MQADWLDRVCPFIHERIERYSKSEIRFNLMAMIKNRKLVHTERIALLEEQKRTVCTEGASGEAPMVRSCPPFLRQNSAKTQPDKQCIFRSRMMTMAKLQLLRMMSRTRLQILMLRLRGKSLDLI